MIYYCSFKLIMGYNMEELSIRITNLLLGKQFIEESQYSIYQYGMQMALEIGLSFITSAIICYIWGKVVEGFIFFSIFIPLRSYLGGFHLKSYKACYICSCVTLVAVLGLSYLGPDYYISWSILSISTLLVFFESLIEKKHDAEGQYFYRKICTIIIIILAVGIVFTVAGHASRLFLLACTCALVTISKILEILRVIYIK